MFPRQVSVVQEGGRSFLAAGWAEFVAAERISRYDIGLFVLIRLSRLIMRLFGNNGLEKPLSRRPLAGDPALADETGAPAAPTATATAASQSDEPPAPPAAPPAAVPPAAPAVVAAPAAVVPPANAHAHAPAPGPGHVQGIIPGKLDFVHPTLKNGTTFNFFIRFIWLTCIFFTIFFGHLGGCRGGRFWVHLLFVFFLTPQHTSPLFLQCRLTSLACSMSLAQGST